MQNNDNRLNLKQALLELLQVVKKNHYTKEENDTKLALKVDDIIYQVDKNNLESEIKNLELSDEQIIGIINDEIKALIPNQATNENQLADKDFVNSSISTATATFRGTYTSKLDFPLIADENDYIWYDTTDEIGNRKFDKYKYSNGEWVYEYTLNNSSFTEEQWKSINSGATVELINQILTNQESINNLDTNKLEKETFNSFKLENNEALNTKVDKTTFDSFKNDNELSLNQKTNNVDFDNFKNETNNNLDTKADKVEGKGLSTVDFTDTNYVHTDNNYTNLEKEKLNGIEENAQVNTITGVKGSEEISYRTGNVSISKGNIGLSNVDNTSDLDKPISILTQNALNNKVDKVVGKSLIEDTEISRLKGMSTGANKVEASITNGNVKIDGVETNVYTLPNNIATKDYVDMNGGKIDAIEVNNVQQEIVNKKVNITVPTNVSELRNDKGYLTEHQDISGKANVSESAYSLDLTIDSSTYVITATLKNKSGSTLSSKKIDLPLESVVVNGSYDSANKQVILTLQSGSTIKFSVADLVSGLQPSESGKGLSTNDFTTELKQLLEESYTKITLSEVDGISYKIDVSSLKPGFYRLYLEAKTSIKFYYLDNNGSQTYFIVNKQVYNMTKGNFVFLYKLDSLDQQSIYPKSQFFVINPRSTATPSYYLELHCVIAGKYNVSNLFNVYSKPKSGIPKSDLSTEVKSSLEKADTALQTHQDISGLQPKITSTNKLSVSLVSGLATTNASGLMSASDKSKLDGIKFTQLYSGKLLGGSSATLSQNPSGNFDFMLVWVTFSEAIRNVFVIPAGYNTFGGTTESEDQSGIYSWYAYKAGTTFTLSTMGYYSDSMTYNARNSNSNYYIDDIEGVKLS